EQVIRLIPQNEDVFRRFQRVNHMLDAPTALFRPAVLLPVLRQALGGARRRTATRLQEVREAESQAAPTTSTVTIHR
ncbi:MAG TPA: hypothetical protein VE685_24860, partial [Thermoanaerobaculia bacterium]|nr:hypothetical protein [Thermoanaerobaculia bacterium]